MNDREYILTVYPNAYCARVGELYQIRRTRNESHKPTLLPYDCLSSQHTSEEQAWQFAAARTRIDEQARREEDTNQSTVLLAHPKAFCAELHGNYYQIRRPRIGSDKPATLDYVTMSGRYSSRPFAWQDAAKKIFANGKGVHAAPQALPLNLPENLKTV
jgi:hypothetical protein